MIEFLIFGLVVLSTVCLWLLIDGRKNPKFLAWFIPILLVLVASTYVTYTSLLGLPKNETPEKGLYLSHYVNEPKWIYLWVLGKNNIPMSYKIVYTRQAHKAMESVKGESDEGKFMVIENTEDLQESEEGDEKTKGGFTIGGDFGFYEWDFESALPPKQ
tara:strand:- start:275 stop:751 length:477 start_codon:yes stop_codon:yes gene_type:complete